MRISKMHIGFTFILIKKSAYENEDEKKKLNENRTNTSSRTCEHMSTHEYIEKGKE